MLRASQGEGSVDSFFVALSFVGIVA